jgi:hypothetical protein
MEHSRFTKCSCGLPDIFIQAFASQRNFWLILANWIWIIYQEALCVHDMFPIAQRLEFIKWKSIHVLGLDLLNAKISSYQFDFAYWSKNHKQFVWFGLGLVWHNRIRMVNCVVKVNSAPPLLLQHDGTLMHAEGATDETLLKYKWIVHLLLSS